MARSALTSVCPRRRRQGFRRVPLLHVASPHATGAEQRKHVVAGIAQHRAFMFLDDVAEPSQRETKTARVSSGSRPRLVAGGPYDIDKQHRQDAQRFAPAACIAECRLARAPSARPRLVV